MSRENRASDVPFSVVLHRSTAWIVFAVLVSAGTLRAQSDTQPPRLIGLTLDPGTVEVTNSSQIVTLQLHLQDDLSGVDSTSGNRVGGDPHEPLRQSSCLWPVAAPGWRNPGWCISSSSQHPPLRGTGIVAHLVRAAARQCRRSEEHTSELQSPCNLVCRLLLEKKKKEHTK